MENFEYNSLVYINLHGKLEAISQRKIWIFRHPTEPRIATFPTVIKILKKPVLWLTHNLSILSNIYINGVIIHLYLHNISKGIMCRYLNSVIDCKSLEKGEIFLLDIFHPFTLHRHQIKFEKRNSTRYFIYSHPVNYHEPWKHMFRCSC